MVALCGACNFLDGEIQAANSRWANNSACSLYNVPYIKRCSEETKFSVLSQDTTWELQKRKSSKLKKIKESSSAFILLFKL